MLSEDERSRASGFHFRRDREFYSAARGTLRHLLGAYLNLAPERVAFRYNRYGKPELEGGGIGFNASHSGMVALQAFVRAARVGVDVEAIRPDVVCEELVATVLSARERAAFRKLSAAAAAAELFRVWTRKEAYLKAVGVGLNYPLRALSVGIAVDHPSRSVEGSDTLSGIEDTCWTVRTLALGAGYAGALVYEGGPRTVRLLALDGRV